MSLSAKRESLVSIHGRLLGSADIPEATKARLRTEHAGLDPFALKKSIEAKLKKFFTVLGNLDRKSTKT